MITQEKIREYINLNREMLLEIFKLSSALYEIDPERYPYLDAALYTSRLDDGSISIFVLDCENSEGNIHSDFTVYDNLLDKSLVRIPTNYLYTPLEEIKEIVRKEKQEYDKEKKNMKIHVIKREIEILKNQLKELEN